MKISIFWTWYVWLVSGACFAEMWHEVLCVDIDEKKIENLKNGIIPIYEPELEEIVKQNYKDGRLNFTTNAIEAIHFGKIIFNAVGTPPDKNNNNKADLTYVYNVAKTFWEHINEYKILVNKSTVPVGTWKECRDVIQKEIQQRGKDIEFDVASNPEFLREWNAIFDFLNPDRVVLWVQNETSQFHLEELYKPLLNKTQIIFTDIKSAEIIKYASNAFLATKISFINEIANFAELAGGNIEDISKWMWADQRIWSQFLQAWIWYGGSCFPKDIKALIETGKDYNFDFKIISQTEAVNLTQKTIVIDKLIKFMPNLSWKRIWIWWLAFKPNTDDIREASSLYVIQRLLDLWVSKIQAYDPICNIWVQNYFQNNPTLEFFDDKYSALQDIDALIVLTEWNEFRLAHMNMLKKLMNTQIIIDGRNIWIDKNLHNEGFQYIWVWKKFKKNLKAD